VISSSKLGKVLIYISTITPSLNGAACFEKSKQLSEHKNIFDLEASIVQNFHPYLRAARFINTTLN
jgi:hypothetical protein